METTKNGEVASVDMKLEVILLGVTDIDRAKAFYEKLGWRLDIDISAGDDFRALQVTPHHSDASIIFGKGVTSASPGSADGLVLAVEDIDAAHAELIARGIDASEVFHYARGPFNNTGENPRVSGRDPEGRSYFSFVSFKDPDGNSWILQEIKTRLPGRVWERDPQSIDVASLAELLHETEQHHGAYESTHEAHHWWDWYAPYLNARQKGSSSEEAAAAADLYMDENLHIARKENT